MVIFTNLFRHTGAGFKIIMSMLIMRFSSDCFSAHDPIFFTADKISDLPYDFLFSDCHLAHRSELLCCDNGRRSTIDG